MEAVFEMVNLSDDDEIFRGYTTMKELYNALKFITMLLFIQKILTFNLVVAFLKSVSILGSRHGMSGGAVGFQNKTRIGIDNPSSPMGPLLCT